MATSSRRLHGLSIVGLVFMMTGGTWLAVGQPAIAGGMFAVGVALFCAGVAAARKAASPGDSTGTRPPTEGGRGQPGDPGDRRGV
jgi:hypothetical protein